MKEKITQVIKDFPFLPTIPLVCPKDRLVLPIIHQERIIELLNLLQGKSLGMYPQKF